MKNIYKENQLLEVINMPSEVIDSIKVTIDILNENYGVNRNIEADLGGYIVIAENIVDIDVLKQDKLQSVIPEYTDEIICSEGVNYTSSLFLFSSDFSVVVIADEELSKILLE